jgi:hypothetical protein
MEVFSVSLWFRQKYAHISLLAKFKGSENYLESAPMGDGRDASNRNVTESLTGRGVSAVFVPEISVLVKWFTLPLS